GLSGPAAANARRSQRPRRVHNIGLLTGHVYTASAAEVSSHNASTASASYYEASESDVLVIDGILGELQTTTLRFSFCHRSHSWAIFPKDSETVPSEATATGAQSGHGGTWVIEDDGRNVYWSSPQQNNQASGYSLTKRDVDDMESIIPGLRS